MRFQYRKNDETDWQPQDMQASSRFEVFGARKGFELAFLISVAIHLIVLCAVFIDKTLRDDTEFKTLNIKLEQSDDDREALANYLEQMQAQEDDALSSEKSANNISQRDDEMLLKQQKEAELNAKANDKAKNQEASAENSGNRKDGLKKNITSASKPTPASRPEPATQKKKQLLGNSKSQDAQALMTYEQLLPLWLNRFRTYPPLARQLRLEGIGVVYLRIDRQGKVLFASISRSTGHQILDDALLAMVAAANPVIPVPKDYNPNENEFSYQIEFKFDLSSDTQIPVYQ